MLFVDYVNFPKKRQQRVDYGFHAYSELCHFVYSLLSKSRAVSSLPGIHEWEAYMDNSAVKEFPAISSELFLVNQDFGKELDSV